MDVSQKKGVSFRAVLMWLLYITPIAILVDEYGKYLDPDNIEVLFDKGLGWAIVWYLVFFGMIVKSINRMESLGNSYSNRLDRVESVVLPVKK